ncbi:MAG: substrate-binding domain-containing protein [Phycisphaerae bacterium]|jgi:LacI family transcriptional regulator
MPSPDNIYCMKKLPRIILMVEPLGEYLQGLLRGIAQYSNSNGPWVFYREPGKHEGTLPQLNPEEADGVIAKIANTAGARKKLPRTVPVILIGYREIIPEMPQIFGDTEAIGKVAAEYFLNKGFRNFAFCGFDEFHWSRERGKSFKLFLENKGYKVHLYRNLKGAMRKSWQLEQQDLAKWLRTLPKPVAILACNDDRGQHLISACKLGKMRIPDEISVLGVDNDKFVCSLTYPPLSSIALGTERAGYEAAQLLAKMMQMKKFINSSIMVRPTHVITRQSTDIIAAEDTLLSEAINYIQKHSNMDISVDDVAGEVMVSRRSLERKFRRQLNKSIYDEIRRIRVNRIISMLLETDLTIAQIGLAMGFKDITHTGRYFKEETGLSPLAYRRKFINQSL